MPLPRHRSRQIQMFPCPIPNQKITLESEFGKNVTFWSRSSLRMHIAHVCVYFPVMSVDYVSSPHLCELVGRDGGSWDWGHARWSTEGRASHHIAGGWLRDIEGGWRWLRDIEGPVRERPVRGTQDGARRGELHITSQGGWLRDTRERLVRGTQDGGARRGACSHIEGPARGT